MTKPQPLPIPRKRPTQLRSQLLVDTMLEAGIRVLEDDGRAGFTTTSVAARAGVSIGSLYQYFGSKDALMAEVILREHLRLLRQVDAALDETRGMALESAVPVLIRLVSEKALPDRVARIVETEEARLPRTLELARVEAAIIERSDAFFRRHLAGRIAASHIPIVTLDVFKIIRGMFDGPQLNNEPADTAALLERIACAVLGYLDRRHWSSVETIRLRARTSNRAALKPR